MAPAGRERAGIPSATVASVSPRPRLIALVALSGAAFAAAAATAEAASPPGTPYASRLHVVDALEALAGVTLGVARSTAPGAPGTLEAAIAHFAPAFANPVREGAAPPVKVGARCPAEMALVAGRVCVDRYEASLLEVTPDRRLVPHSPYHAPAAGKVYFAHSAPYVVPQAYINGAQAASACQAAQKRLCEPVEWRAACGGKQGTAYPYGPKHVAGACNDRGVSAVTLIHGATKNAWGFAELNDPRINAHPGTVAGAGTFYSCVNDYGIWDMVGNLHEWTADPNGTFQGGYYLDTTEHGEGCAYRTIAHEFEYKDYSIGFRCCADPT